MAGYVRQSSAEIVTGAVVLAAPLNSEFNALQSAFHATTGHTHDGSSANGPKVSLTASISGILPIANGGTNASTAAAARTSLFGVSTTVDNTIPRFNGTTGELQTSDAILTDAGGLTLTSTDAGAAANPTLSLFRDSASPAAADLIGYFTFQGKDAAGNNTTYADLFSTIVDTTDLSEDGALTFRVAVAGTVANRLVLNTAGVTLSGTVTATGGGSLTGTWSNLGTVTTVDINGGTIDGAVIGGASAAAGTFTTLNASGAFTGAAISGTTGTFSGAVSTGALTATAGTGIATLNATNLTIGTVPVARVSGSYTSITGTGALNAGSITSGFGNINIGASTFTTTGAVSTGAIVATGSITSSAGITASQNFLASTNQVLIANASAGTLFLRANGNIATNQATLSSAGVFTAPEFSGDGGSLTALNATQLTTGTVPVARVSGSYTSITGTGALNAGSITSGFGSINIGASTFTTTGTVSTGAVIASGSVFATQNFLSTTATLLMATDGAGTFLFRPNGSGSGTGQMSLGSTGNLVVAGTITASSDARLKTDVETVKNGLDKINSLRGVSFTKDNQKSIGVIAQEVREVLPELVLEDTDGYLSVAYGNIVGVLIEAVKELTQKVKELEAR